MSYAKIRMRRHACMVERCVGRGIPQHAPLYRTGYYIRLATDFLSLHFVPWKICNNTNTEIFHQKQGALWVPNLILSVPVSLLSSHLFKASKQAVPLAPTQASFVPNQVLWHLCSLEVMDASGCGKYTEHCCVLVYYCSSLCMTNFISVAKCFL